MDASQFIALDILFLRRRHCRVMYLRAQRAMDDALARRRPGSEAPSDADFDELSRLMMKSERADVEYLRMLGAVTRGVIEDAKRDVSDGRVKTVS